MRSLPLLLVLVAALASASCGGKSPGTGGSGAGGSASTTTSSTSKSTSMTTSSTATGTGGMPPDDCPTGGTEVPTLTTCTTPDTSIVTVPKGCAPTVDGVIHDVEWKDGACFNVIGEAGMVVVVKYSGNNFYMATSNPPPCACAIQFYFEPIGGGKNFGVTVLDQPVGTDGDRSDFMLTGSGLMMIAKDPSIDVACPGNMPVPVRYEWSIPLAELGIVEGSPGQFQMAITHVGTNWPTGLHVNAAMHAVFENGEPSWGALKSSSWQ